MSAGFQFKEFYIKHDQCAMKVGTDSIMLGSWVQTDSAKHILDIGTGSGLLAIMLAQKSLPGAEITAIDLDCDAIKQANFNGKNSPWPDKVVFLKSSLQDFKAHHQFDLIVSNPPYFEPKSGLLKTSDPQFIESKRRTARHTLALSHEELLLSISRLLSPQGRCYLVLPERACKPFEQLVTTTDLSINRQLLVSPKAEKKGIRRLIMLSKSNSESRLERLVIHSEDGQYSQEYRTLCKDFYLNF